MILGRTTRATDQCTSLLRFPFPAARFPGSNRIEARGRFGRNHCVISSIVRPLRYRAIAIETHRCAKKALVTTPSLSLGNLFSQRDAKGVSTSNLTEWAPNCHVLWSVFSPTRRIQIRLTNTGRDAKTTTAFCTVLRVTSGVR